MLEHLCLPMLVNASASCPWMAFRPPTHTWSPAWLLSACHAVSRMSLYAPVAKLLSMGKVSRQCCSAPMDEVLATDFLVDLAVA